VPRPDFPLSIPVYIIEIILCNCMNTGDFLIFI